MPQEPLVIDDLSGPKDGQRILRLSGPLVMATLFDFQAKVRADNSRALIIDFTSVPYVDSAGIGALVGAYVTHQKGGHSLALVGVSDRIRTHSRSRAWKAFFVFSAPPRRRRTPPEKVWARPRFSGAFNRPARTECLIQPDLEGTLCPGTLSDYPQ